MTDRVKNKGLDLQSHERLDLLLKSFMRAFKKKILSDFANHTQGYVHKKRYRPNEYYLSELTSFVSKTNSDLPIEKN